MYASISSVVSGHLQKGFEWFIDLQSKKESTEIVWQLKNEVTFEEKTFKSMMYIPAKRKLKMQFYRRIHLESKTLSI